eukprot:CAMPEP_0185278056 /NCGR_PEP_ID=MMETSP1359-20130426/60076_1 /TAXON_ID=552665 /ORGANISM="Bigelowiella longifila, Strain CCMP242" /LENGTH=348 /DNA_ID=CAMNT_0027872411 /DNA_START=56 /DNA_END=1103 /DNA_ORIENTATION=-
MVKNNYKSGRVATLMDGSFGGNEAQDPTVVGEPYKVEGQNMNMNMLIFNNIRADMYFREELSHIKTWEGFLEKTVKEVRECTPWITGTHTVTTKKGMCSGTRGVGTQGRPTRMWTHLVKLWTMKPTERQLEQLVESKQSPYLRVMGFLYLRYCAPRAVVWDWLSPYIDETEGIQVERLTKTMWPIGKLVRTFLTETKFYDTHFPRFPVKMQRDINAGIKRWDKEQGREEGVDPFGGGSDDRDRDRKSRGDRDERRYNDRDRGEEVTAVKETETEIDRAKGEEEVAAIDREAEDEAQIAEEIVKGIETGTGNVSAGEETARNQDRERETAIANGVDAVATIVGRQLLDP